MLKGVDTSPVVTAKVSTHAITLTRQSLDESSSAYLSYDRVINAIEGHRSLKNWLYNEIIIHQEYILIVYQNVFI